MLFNTLSAREAAHNLIMIAPAKNSKAKSSAPRFYDYLDGLQEEFDLSLANNSRPRRFASYLDGLKSEFELITEDIESVQKERDGFKAKGMRCAGMEILVLM